MADPKRMKVNGINTEEETSWDRLQDRVLLEPFEYVCKIPGKKIRTKLIQAFNLWLQISDEKLGQIGEVVEMLHNASLMIDDIEDDSILRRGIPVAHKIYGVPHTINSANYVYFLGLQKALDLGHPEATRVFTEQLLELHKGQGMDIYWRDASICPTEDEYRKMVIQKTGGLFGLGVRLMQLFSDRSSTDLKPLLDNLGLFFQIRDDYANLCSKEYSDAKTFCEDLTEGKFSFLLLHGIQKNQQPESNQIRNIIRQRTTEVDVKKYCVQLLRRTGSFDYAADKLKSLKTEIEEQLNQLGGNAHLQKLMNDLASLYENDSEKK